MTDLHIVYQLDKLQLRIARALDERDMRGWGDCFATEASYVCTSRENLDEGLPIGIMMDDSRAKIEDRIKAVTEVWTGTFEDYQTRHISQRFGHAEISEGRWSMHSTFIVAFTNETAETRLLATGVYVDEITFEDGQPKFAKRTAILDANAPPRYLVYPI